MVDHSSGFLDIVFTVVALATVAKILPPIAAFLSIIWTASRFYDKWKSYRAKRVCENCKGDNVDI